MKTIKALSLCSGAGGTEILLDSRIQVIAHSEINEAARSILRFHHPQVPILGDMKKISALHLPKFNLLLGGTPCQNLSYQGNRKGLKGDKSSLFYEYLRILKEGKPEYFLWENVKGTLTSNGGEDYKIIQTLFKEAGYEIQSRLFNAKDFGTIQARERIFIFGTRRGLKKNISRKLDSVIYGGEKYIKDKGKKIIAYSKSTRENHLDYRLREDGLVNTLTTGKGCAGQSTANYIYKNGYLRFLNPNECEKLMTWPQDYTKYGINQKGEKIIISDNQRFKAIGNGIVSTIPQAIIEQLILNQS